MAHTFFAFKIEEVVVFIKKEDTVEKGIDLFFYLYIDINIFVTDIDETFVKGNKINIDTIQHLLIIKKEINNNSNNNDIGNHMDNNNWTGIYIHFNQKGKNKQNKKDVNDKNIFICVPLFPDFEKYSAIAIGNFTTILTLDNVHNTNYLYFFLITKHILSFLNDLVHYTSNA